MAQGKPTSRPPETPKAPADPFAWVTQVAFYLALVLVAARATLPDALRDPFEAMPGQGPSPRAPGPTTSLLLSLLCGVPALLILLRRVLDSTYVIRWNWSHVWMGMLALWMALSPLWAADRFAAMVSSSTWIAAFVMLWSMSQLVRSWKRLRLVAGVGVGLLLIYSAAQLEYRFVDLPEMRRNWEEHKSEILRERNLEPGSFGAHQFELKVMGGDVGQFVSSPNSFAAALVGLGIVAAGVGIQRLVNRDHLGWIVPIAVALPLAAWAGYYTHSRSASATPVLAGLILVACWRMGGWLHARARLAFGMGVAGFALLAIAVVGHGLYHGNLGEKSLTFRWYYWSGAARALAQHPALGLGWANFGPGYLQVRGAHATEEVKDPHNFIVRFFVELGVVGGVMLVGWMVCLWRDLTRPVVLAAGEAEPRAERRSILKLNALALSAMTVTFFAATDLTQGSAWAFLQGFRCFAGAILLLAGLCAAYFRSLLSETPDERPAPWILYATIVSIGMLLIHSLIDIAVSETQVLFIFALLCGAALGLRQEPVAGKRKRTAVAIGVFCAGVVAWLAFAGFYFGRTAAAEASAQSAEDAIRARRFDEAYKLLDEARKSQPLNAEYAFKAAQALVYQNGSPLFIRGLLDEAVAGNPMSVRYRRFRAQYELRQPTPEAGAVQKAYQAALALDPRNVELRLEYAEALAKLGDSAGAVDQYREALHRDDELPADEPKRLTAGKREEVEKRMAGLTP